MSERKLEIKEQRAILSCLLILEEFLVNLRNSSDENVKIAAELAANKMSGEIKILEKTFRELDAERHL